MKFKNNRKIVFIIGIFMLVAGIVASIFVLTSLEPQNNESGKKEYADSYDKRTYIYAFQRLRESFSENVPEFYYYTKDIDGNGKYELLILENTTLYIYTYKDREIHQIGSHDFVTGTFQFLESDNYNGIFVYTVGGGCDHYSYLTLCDDNISMTKLCEYYFSADEPYWKDIGDDKKMVAEAKNVYSNVITFSQYTPINFQGNALSTSRDIGEMQPETQEIITIDDKCYQSYVASNVDIRYIWVNKEEHEMSATWDWVPVGTSKFYSLELLGNVNEGRK